MTQVTSRMTHETPEQDFYKGKNTKKKKQKED